MADVWANSMACHLRATYHIAGCCHLVNSLTATISEPHATLQGAVTWRNQCRDRAILQGVRISSAILKVAIFYYAPAPVEEAGALGGHRRPSSVRPSVCLSVSLSDVAYIGSNSKTKRPRKTKLCTGVPQVTCDSHTDFNVKRSKVKVTGRRHIVAAT